MADEERLQNFLARRGIASRRAAAALVASGRVAVNGEVETAPGCAVDSERDRVAVDGKPVPNAAPRRRTLMLYKPRGYVCSADRSQGRSVCDLVPRETAPLLPVGRLDKESEGLLLMTNDGGLMLRLTHPRYGHVKTYEVTVRGVPDMKSLRAPIEIDGKMTRPAHVEMLARDGSRPILRFQLSEGRNQQIRRLCERAGLEVERLVRTAVNTLALPADMRPGQWRELSETEDGLKIHAPL